ncbi:MAG: isoprenylcysteine carboxylmethyltransferase family protein [Pseudomonadota bacterium]|nr:isoprenylcysteine carboxylmethyltransferase family protein [Pseudomonadota bacterium]
MIPFWVIWGLLVVQRLAELALARRNTARLLAGGAIEHGARHYPLFVVLHTAWLATLILAGDPALPVHPAWIAAFLVLQAGRVWVIASLGRYWTTRIIVVPGAPMVRRGPYRFMRHPNYVVVIAEFLVISLMANLAWVAIVFSLLNAALLAWRIRIEEGANASRVSD